MTNDDDNGAGRMSGINWNAARGKWQARIKIAGKTKHLGLFADYGEACAVRRVAEQEAVALARVLKPDGATAGRKGRGKTGKGRANVFEMEARFRELIEIVERIRPATVRQAFYQAVVAMLVRKDGYAKVQTAIVKLRREGRVSFADITDATRFVIEPPTYEGIGDALTQLAQRYRRNPWLETPVAVFVWLEKDALTGVIEDVTWEHCVPLVVARGFSSLTRLQEEARKIAEIGKPVYIYLIGDHDPSGRSAHQKIEAELRGFAPDAEIHVYRLAVTEQQAAETDPETGAFVLPRHDVNLDDPRAAEFIAAHGDQAIEADAIEPNRLRRIVRAAIERHIDPVIFARVQERQEDERRLLEALAGQDWSRR